MGHTFQMIWCIDAPYFSSAVQQHAPTPARTRRTTAQVQCHLDLSAFIVFRSRICLENVIDSLQCSCLNPQRAAIEDGGDRYGPTFVIDPVQIFDGG